MAHARRLAARDRLVVLQVVPEELGQFIERDEVYPIVKIHVASARNNEQFFGMAGQPVSPFAEFSGMGVLLTSVPRTIMLTSIPVSFCSNTTAIVLAIAFSLATYSAARTAEASLLPSSNGRSCTPQDQIRHQCEWDCPTV